jgi:hypothetical protein
VDPSQARPWHATGAEKHLSEGSADFPMGFSARKIQLDFLEPSAGGKFWNSRQFFLQYKWIFRFSDFQISRHVKN